MTLPASETPIEVPNCNPPLKPSELGGYDLELSLAELTRPMDMAAIFGRTAPTEIEIGSGSGLYLAIEAARHPDRNFFGIELDAQQVKRAKDKWRRRNLLNTRILRCDAHYFMEEYPLPESIDQVTILFSDPWPKTRHHKRRVFQPRLLPALNRILKPGGDLYVKTDVTSYWEVMRELLHSADFLENTADFRLDEQADPNDIETNYQSKALEVGRPIHVLRYRKR